MGFLDLYNTSCIAQRACAQFAEEYPGIAERLGGLLEDRIDPFDRRAAGKEPPSCGRVQLKLKHESRVTETCWNSWSRIISPDPSMMIVKATPVFATRRTRGPTIAPRLLSRCEFRQLDRQIALPLRLCGDIRDMAVSMLVAAEYYPSPAPLQALGNFVGGEALAGLRSA